MKHFYGFLTYIKPKWTIVIPFLMGIIFSIISFRQEVNIMGWFFLTVSGVAFFGSIIDYFKNHQIKEN